MSAPKVSVPRGMWFKEEELELEFPESWEVVPCLMQGHDAPPVTQVEIQAALDSPVGSPRLRELARGKSEVAIIFDDMSRPTRTGIIAPYVLAELAAAGIPDTAVRFVCALGSHGAHTYQDFEKKLGSEIMDRYPVYNHNPYENCTYVGDTSSGTRLSVNAEVMTCDLKIAIGSVIPHPQAGYGGGGKIIIPGIASIDSIEALHRLDINARREGRGNTVGFGRYTENPLVTECLEVARMVGLNFKIDTIINGRGQPCAVFAGEPEAEYYRAVQYAEPHYATKAVSGADVVVINNYSKGNEAIVGYGMGMRLLMEKGGDLVMSYDFHTGQVVHYLLGSFGKSTRGRLSSGGGGRRQIPFLKRLIVLSPQIEKSFGDWLGVADICWVKTWAEARALLEQDFPDGARAVVVPDGTVQYLV